MPINNNPVKFAHYSRASFDILSKDADTFYAVAEANGDITFYIGNTQIGAKTSHTHVKANITDFPVSMPASDVYSWAKAVSKPSYNHDEITDGATYKRVSQTEKNTWDAKLSSITKAMVEAVLTGTITSHNHTGTYQAVHTALTNLINLMGLAETGRIVKNGVNTFSLDEATYLTSITKAMVEAVLTGNITTHTHDNYQPLHAILTALAGLGTGAGFVKKTGASSFTLDTATYLTAITKAMVEAVLTGVITSHTHGKAQITNFDAEVLALSPAGSRPASDVYAWAKAASKPSYVWSEIGSRPSTIVDYNFSDFKVNLTSQDANNITISGFYHCSANIPTSDGESDKAVIHNQYGGGTTWATQIAISWRNGRMWFRNKENGTWEAWHEVYSTNKKPSASDVGALASGGTAVNSDKVDNKHVWVGTQASYNAIGTYDADTIYFIVG